MTGKLGAIGAKAASTNSHVLGTVPKDCLSKVAQWLYDFILDHQPELFLYHTGEFTLPEMKEKWDSLKEMDVAIAAKLDELKPPVNDGFDSDNVDFSDPDDDENAHAADPVIEEIAEAFWQVFTNKFYPITTSFADLVNSTGAEQNKLYRRLSLKVHPDKDNTPGAAGVFLAVQKIHEYYEELGVSGVVKLPPYQQHYINGIPWVIAKVAEELATQQAQQGQQATQQMVLVGEAKTQQVPAQAEAKAGGDSSVGGGEGEVEKLRADLAEAERRNEEVTEALSKAQQEQAEALLKLQQENEDLRKRAEEVEAKAAAEAKAQEEEDGGEVEVNQEPGDAMDDEEQAQQVGEGVAVKEDSGGGSRAAEAGQEGGEEDEGTVRKIPLGIVRLYAQCCDVCGPNGQRPALRAR